MLIFLRQNSGWAGGVVVVSLCFSRSGASTALRQETAGCVSDHCLFSWASLRRCASWKFHLQKCRESKLPQNGNWKHPRSSPIILSSRKITLHRTFVSAFSTCFRGWEMIWGRHKSWRKNASLQFCPTPVMVSRPLPPPCSWMILWLMIFAGFSFFFEVWNLSQSRGK